MESFTTIIRYAPTFNVQAYDIYAATRNVMESMLTASPRGAKCDYTLSLIDKDGVKFLASTITLMNMKSTLLDKALVISETPAVAEFRFHAWDHRTPIACACGCKKFYDVGRSLDYNNLVCSVCGAEAHTITETGASA